MKSRVLVIDDEAAIRDSLRMPSPVAMKRQISRLANENNRASVVTATHGLIQCGCRFLPVPPRPAWTP